MCSSIFMTDYTGLQSWSRKRQPRRLHPWNKWLFSDKHDPFRCPRCREKGKRTRYPSGKVIQHFVWKVDIFPKKNSFYGCNGFSILVKCIDYSIYSVHISPIKWSWWFVVKWAVHSLRVQWSFSCCCCLLLRGQLNFVYLHVFEMLKGPLSGRLSFLFWVVII